MYIDIIGSGSIGGTKARKMAAGHTIKLEGSRGRPLLRASGETTTARRTRH